MFTKWLEDTYPNKKEKELNRLRSLRNGGLYNSDYGSRMVGQGVFAKQIADLLKLSVRKAGIASKGPILDPTGFITPFGKQMTLFIES